MANLMMYNYNDNKNTYLLMHHNLEKEYPEWKKLPVEGGEIEIVGTLI